MEKMYIMKDEDGTTDYVDIYDIAGMTIWYGYYSYQDGEKFIIEDSNGKDRKEIYGTDIIYRLEHLNDLVGEDENIGGWW